MDKLCFKFKSLYCFPLSFTFNRWFSRYVIAAKLVDGKQRSLISSFCLSTSIFSFHHCYLCLPRLHENHLYRAIFVYPLSHYTQIQRNSTAYVIAHCVCSQSAMFFHLCTICKLIYYNTAITTFLTNRIQVQMTGK